MLRVAACLGASGVVAGALGAHGPVSELLAERGTGPDYETGVAYHMYHALALLGLAVLRNAGFRTAGAAWCMLLGVVMFSGSLYSLALDGPRWLGPVTPVGGVFLIVGWALLLFTRRDGGPDLGES